MRTASRLIALGSILLMVSATPAEAPAQANRSGPPLLARLLFVLQTGDQAAYERFVQATYSPAALAESPAPDWASSLARIYTDTGGLEVERVVTDGPEKVHALAHARLTGLSYCLTLSRSSAGGRETISDVTSAGVYPAGPGLKTPEPAELISLADGLASKFTAAGEFSGVMLLAKDGKVIFRKAYGGESLAYPSPVTLDTRLNIASIGKSLTGVAIAQLVDAGKLSFDDTVGKVLPDYPDAAVRDKVTIRQLLIHTSGMGRRTTMTTRAGRPCACVWPPSPITCGW